jgi:Flp pilus assembly protein TadG
MHSAGFKASKLQHRARHIARTRPGRVRRREKARGQALVELALIVPVLVLMLAIAADFGRAFTSYITISGAAREGAAFGMASSTHASDTDGIRAAALADAPLIWGTAPEVVSTTGIDPHGYLMVQVSVSYTFLPIIRIPPIPNSIHMTRTVQMRIIN